MNYIQKAFALLQRPRGALIQSIGQGSEQDLKATVNRAVPIFNTSTGLHESRILAAADIPTLTSSKISDFTEAAQDATGAMVANGTYVSLTYVDATPSLTADAIATTRDIPYWVYANVVTGTMPTMPDEVATNFITVLFHVPTTWDGSTNITVKTIWFADSTGNCDLETQILSFTEVDENQVVVVQAFTDTNLSWTTANRAKVLTTTITPTAGLYYRVQFRRNTGDANTGTLFLQNAAVTTKVF